MLCPNCKKELEEVVEISHYGLPIKINQCKNCGGIWFDDLNLFELEEKEAKKLEDIKVKNPKEDFDNQKEKFCPTCKIPLIKLQDPNIPQNINIENCPKCEGLWMNHGETLKYKEYQEKKMAEDSEEKTGEEKEFDRELAKNNPDLILELNEDKTNPDVPIFGGEEDKKSEEMTVGNLIKKIVAGGISLYFIISEAYYLIHSSPNSLADMELHHPLLFIITIFKYLLVFLLLPFLYFFKILVHILDYFNIDASYRLREYDEPQDIKTGLLEVKLFYWVIYSIIIILSIIRVVSYLFMAIFK